MIYFDHNATTPVLPEVRTEVARALEVLWGNPSSIHGVGQIVHQEVERARATLAALWNVTPARVVFTGSATEACTLAVHSGISQRGNRAKMLVAETEHAALHAWTRKANDAIQVETLRVAPNGEIDLKAAKEDITEDVFLVAAMMANNETGVTHSLDALAELCAERGAFLLCDAVQAFGKIPIRLMRVEPHYTIYSAHKIGGPKGVGALVLGPTAECSPIFLGGGQEAGRRAGTENVPGILGFARAAELAIETLEMRSRHCAMLRDTFERSIRPFGAEFFGANAERLPNTSNFRLPGVESQMLVELLDGEGICASSGSACHAGAQEPSHVIFAMTRSYEIAQQAVRFSFGASNTLQEVEQAVAALQRILRRLP